MPQIFHLYVIRHSEITQPSRTLREAEKLFWKEKVRKKETLNGIGQSTVSARGRNTISSLAESGLILFSIVVDICIRVLVLP